MSFTRLSNNVLNTVTVSSEDASFLVANLQNTSPKKKWQVSSNITTAILTCDITGAMDLIGIAGTNAISASVIVSDPNKLSLGGDTSLASPDTLGDGDTISNVDLSITATVTKRARTKGMLIAISPQTTGAVEAQITLTAGETLYAGVLQAGVGQAFRGPSYGLSENRIDTSITKELSNGERYRKERDKLRSFGCSTVLNRTSTTLNDWYDFADIYDVNGETPFFWKMTELTGSQWVVFGSFDGPPEASHDYPSHSTINFNIREAL